ncbi:MAG: LysM peptidoglycan-binding domain-containing protein [Planctomycetota bacterium]
MQQIERYGVIALVFLLVTIVAVSFWGDSKSPGFWSRLTGRGAKKDATADQVSNMIPPATSTERAIDPSLPLTANEAAAPAGTEWQAPAAVTTNDPWMNTPIAPPEIAGQPIPPAHAPSPAGEGSATGYTEPAPRSPATAVPPVPAGPQYTVQRGDSLIRIAARTLGSGNRWTEIQALNGGLDPRGLRPGMKLVLPATAKLEAKGSASPGRATTKPKAASKPATGTYVVRAGDTLTGIAARLLGDGDRWRELVAANPGLDPKRLFVGKSIRVPAAGAQAPREGGARTAAARTSPARAPVVASANPRSDRPRVR